MYMCTCIQCHCSPQPKSKDSVCTCTFPTSGELSASMPFFFQLCVCVCVCVCVLLFSLPSPRVVQVSRRWWWLAQYSTLRKKRQKYLQHKRDKYLQSKVYATRLGISRLATHISATPFDLCVNTFISQENAAPGQRHSNRTPCTVTRQSLANCGNSPLTSVQCSRHRHTRLNSPRGERNTDGETPIRLPRYHHHHSLCRSERQSAGSPLFQTPEHAASDAYTTTDDELSYMVRRCLFPNSPALSRQKQTCHPVTDCDNTQGMDSDLSIKKTASRRRLKRL